MNQLIFSISGVRGKVPDSLTPKIVYRLGLAFAKTQLPGKILLAQDTRPTGVALIAILKQAMVTAGREFLNCGICPTPTAQFQIEHGKFSGGIVVTASHNPLPYNGLKFINSNGIFCGANELQQILEEFRRRNEIPRQTPDFSTARIFSGEEHMAAILDNPIIDVGQICSKQLKIVLDAVNGVGAVMMPLLLKKLGCEVVTLYCEPNGLFSRGADPLPENLDDLSKVVVKNSANLGLAMDPDGDRLDLVDENGIPIGEEKTLPLVVDFVLSREKSRQNVVTNLSTSMMIESICKKHGAILHRTAIGEINVVKKMKEVGSIIGGEGNGGVIYPSVHSGRDAFVGCALILQAIAESKKTISELASKLPTYYIAKEKVEFADLDYQSVLKKIINHANDAKINDRDGIKLSWLNRWVHIRKSNTEPIMRIYAEASSKKEAQELVEVYKNILK